MSKTSKKAKADLDAAEKKLREEQGKVEQAEFGQVFDMMGAFGSSAFVVQPNARGFSVAGGQFIGTDTLGGVVDSVLTLSSRTGSNVDRTAVDQARTAHQDAMTKYREARKADWKKANKGGRGKKAAEPKPDAPAKRAAPKKKEDSK